MISGEECGRGRHFHHLSRRAAALCMGNYKTADFTRGKATSPTHRALPCARSRFWLPARSICSGERNILGNMKFSPGLQHIIIIFFLLVGA